MGVISTFSRMDLEIARYKWNEIYDPLLFTTQSNLNKTRYLNDTLSPETRSVIKKEPAKERPRLKLLKRTVTTPVNSMANNSQQENIFGHAKPIGGFRCP